MYTYYGKKNIKCALIAHVVVGIVNLTVVSCSLLVLLPYCGVGVLASIITSSVVDMSGSTLCCSSSPLRASCLVDQVHVPLLPPWRYPSTIKCDHKQQRFHTLLFSPCILYFSFFWCVTIFLYTACRSLWPVLLLLINRTQRAFTRYYDFKKICLRIYTKSKIVNFLFQVRENHHP